ncbi:hypothetical protein [Tahibacter amnicola]|uniref:Parallel beta helix pectate lyase-like protein n=1 Tax=Tahibacter amnicola TaxID=2976241 RepID=A0ABY6BFK7_9GAMM|nr:hypothetical protein [Tahibacter amnicola]UXI68809.1 hypothetical protein N4264_03905 [Tahibacter amnicola]
MTLKYLKLRAAALAAATGLAPMLASAAIYTVGPGGTHTTIQGAIDAALASAGNDEVRVHTGTYNEAINVPFTMTTDRLVMSGGWNDGYATQAADGALNTIVSPGANQIAARLGPTGGTLVVDRFHFYGAEVNASGNQGGAGMRIFMSNGDASVTVTGSIFQENVLTGSTGNAVRGAALHADASGGGTLIVSNNQFINNRGVIAQGHSEIIAGAVIQFGCYGTRNCHMLGNTVLNSTADAPGRQVFGMVRVIAGADSTVRFDRNRIEGLVFGSTTSEARPRSLSLEAYTNGSLVARGNRIHAGSPVGTIITGPEVSLNAGDQASILFGDSLVARAPRYAVTTDISSSAVVHLTNLTLADNGYDVYMSSTSSNPAQVSNNLMGSAFDDNTFNGAQLQNNRFGLTLPFVAPSLYDYSLARPVVSVTDSGTNTPVGGLGTVDIAGAARLQGATVDIGAWEDSDRIFADRLDR